MKCEQYWPTKHRDCEFDWIAVTCLSENIYSDYTRRNLEVRHAGDVLKVQEMRNIKYDHYLISVFLR